MWPHPIIYRQRDLKVIITCPACLRTSLSNKGHCIWLREPRPRELFPSTGDFWQLTTEVTKGSAHTGLWGWNTLWIFFTLLFACLFVWTPSLKHEWVCIWLRELRPSELFFLYHQFLTAIDGSSERMCTLRAQWNEIGSKHFFSLAK